MPKEPELKARDKVVMIPALSRLPKRLSQKTKSQKIHPRTHTKLCQCQKHR